MSEYSENAITHFLCGIAHIMLTINEHCIIISIE